MVYGTAWPLSERLLLVRVLAERRRARHLPARRLRKPGTALSGPGDRLPGPGSGEAAAGPADRAGRRRTGPAGAGARVPRRRRRASPWTPARPAASETAVVGLVNVYDSLLPVPRGREDPVAEDRSLASEEHAPAPQAADRVRLGDGRRGRFWGPCRSRTTAARASICRRASRSTFRPWTSGAAPCSRCAAPPTCSAGETTRLRRVPRAQGTIAGQARCRSARRRFRRDPSRDPAGAGGAAIP